MKQFPTLQKVQDSPHTGILFISSNSGKISLPLNTGTVIGRFILQVIDTLWNWLQKSLHDLLYGEDYRPTTLPHEILQVPDDAQAYVAHGEVSLDMIVVPGKGGSCLQVSLQHSATLLKGGLIGFQVFLQVLVPPLLMAAFSLPGFSSFLTSLSSILPLSPESLSARFIEWVTWTLASDFSFLYQGHSPRFLWI